MIKILVATPLFPPEIGGPATYAHMLESELESRGFEVEIVPFAAARRWPRLIRHIVYYFTLVKKSRSGILFMLSIPLVSVFRLCWPPGGVGKYFCYGCRAIMLGSRDSFGLGYK